MMDAQGAPKRVEGAGAQEARDSGIPRQQARPARGSRSLLCDVCLVGPVTSDSATPGAVTRQAPLSMGCSRQERRNGLEFPSAGDLPDPGIKSTSLRPLHCQAGCLPAALRVTSLFILALVIFLQNSESLMLFKASASLKGHKGCVLVVSLSFKHPRATRWRDNSGNCSDWPPVRGKQIAQEVSEHHLSQGRLYPPLSTIRDVSLRIAIKVLDFAYKHNLASYYPEPEDKEAFVRSLVYTPEYDSFTLDSYTWPEEAMNVQTI